MDHNDLITKAISFARDHAQDHALSLQDIADAAGFSLDYFNRIFLANTGFTVMAYVNYVRLKKALILLRTTDKSILDIALEIGYSSQEGFGKAFQKKYDVTPGEYRRQMKGKIIKAAEVADAAVAARFIHDNPDFTLADTNEVIEYLLDTDALKYGRLCGEIKHMGIHMAVQNHDFQRGFIGIRAVSAENCVLELVTEDMKLLAEWLKRFRSKSFKISFCCNREAHEVLAFLREKGVDINVTYRPQAVYQGAGLNCTLPEAIQIKKLGKADLPAVMKWAKGKNDVYTKQLLIPEYYRDESVLEYGIFEKDELIAVAGCGIDEVQGLRMNDCCIIRFAVGGEETELYRPVYAAVTELLWQDGIVPYDELQFGEYAKKHGNFTCVDLGYRVVNRKYDVVIS